MPLQKPNPVYAASKRKYTAEGREYQGPWGCINEWWKVEWEIDTRIGEASTILRELLSLCGHKTGAFKHRKTISF